MRSHTREAGTAVLFLLPNFLGFLIFTLVPLLLSFLGSFTSWNLRPSVPLKFVGLENFASLFSDPDFYFYLYNTFFLLLGLPLSIFGALILAVLLSEGMTLRSRRLAGIAEKSFAASIGTIVVVLLMNGWQDLAFIIANVGVFGYFGLRFKSISYRTLFYLPHFTAGAATIILWKQLYNPHFGLINQCIDWSNATLGLSLSAPGWLSSTKSLLGFLPLPEHFNNGGFGLGAREAIVIMGVWGAIGGNNMLLYLAAISNINPELYEAAGIDGANAWQRFWHITLPQVAPTTFFIVIMSIIGGLQGGFEQVRLLTEGGPAGTTTTLSYYIYVQAFQRLDLGYGCAVAWVLFLIILVLTLVNWKYGKGGYE